MAQNEDPQRVRQMNRAELEYRALGVSANPRLAAAASVEIRRRDTEEREAERQRDAENAERIARVQIEAAEKVVKQQLPIARASAWAAGFAALAALIVAGIALLEFLTGRQ